MSILHLVVVNNNHHPNKSGVGCGGEGCCTGVYCDCCVSAIHICLLGGVFGVVCGSGLVLLKFVVVIGYWWW